MGKRGEGGRGRRVGIRRKPGEVGGDGEKLKKFNVKGIVHQFFFYCFLLILAGGVYKQPKLNIFGFLFCPQGPRLAAPQGTSTRGAWDLGAASRGPLSLVEFWPFKDPSGQNQLYHTPITIQNMRLNDREKLVNNPFKFKRKAICFCLRYPNAEEYREYD